MKIILTILCLFLCNSLQSQGMNDERKIKVYPITRGVYNLYDTTFYKYVNQSSLASLDSFKRMAIESLKSQSNYSGIIKAQPDFLTKFEGSMSDPIKASEIFNSRGIYLSIDSAKIRTLLKPLTSFDLEQISKIRNQFNNVNSVWNINLSDFKTIPLRDSYGQLEMFVVNKMATSIDQQIDGDYVFNYSPIYVGNKEFNSNIPYCYFSILDGKPNGTALFLLPSGDTLAYGNYRNGKQDGKWHITIPYSYTNNTSNSLKQLQIGNVFLDIYGNLKDSIESGWGEYVIEFKEGVPHGIYEFYQNSVLRSKGVLAEGTPIGAWEIYFSNGQLANRINLRQIPITLPDDYVFPEMLDANQLLGTNIKDSDNLPFGNTRINIIGLDDGFYDIDYDYYGNIIGDIGKSNVDLITLTSDNKRLLKFENEFNAFYKNAELFFSMELSDFGKTIQMTEKIYAENGEILCVWSFNKHYTKAKYILFNGKKPSFIRYYGKTKNHSKKS